MVRLERVEKEDPTPGPPERERARGSRDPEPRRDEDEASKIEVLREDPKERGSMGRSSSLKLYHWSL